MIYERFQDFAWHCSSLWAHLFVGCLCLSQSVPRWTTQATDTGLLLDSLSADLICKRNSNTLYTLLFNYVVHCSKSLHSHRRTTSSSAGRSLHLPITPCHGFKLYKLSLLLNLYYKRAVAVKCCKCSAPIASNFGFISFLPVKECKSLPSPMRKNRVEWIERYLNF